ncbi:hypothetical protein [Azonexus sp.]|uniref:hypothetical protein n=1 Tax=Azonexus sp. TaxID=1872668 RepID=UPI0035B3B535
MDGIANPMPLLAGAVCYFSLALHRRVLRREMAASLASTLAACDAVREVVDALQRHRAAACARLAGDAAAGRCLVERQRAVAEGLVRLRERARKERGALHPCLERADFASLEAGWQRLAGEWPGFGVEQCQAHHGRLVDLLLRRLADFAEPRLGALLGDEAQRGTVRNYAVRLPGLAESLYQAELLGFAVAGAAADATHARVRLSLLLARVEAALGQAREAGGEMPEADAAGLAVRAVAQAARRILPAGGAPAALSEFHRLVEAAIASLDAWQEACRGNLIHASLCEDDDGLRLQAA